MQACIEGGGDRVCSAESKWQTLLCSGGDEGLGWSVVEVRGRRNTLEELCPREKLSFSLAEQVKGRGDKDGSSTLYVENEEFR